MAARMQQRHGTAAQWTAADPVLAVGEIGYDSTNNIIKFGDGVTKWSLLASFTVTKAKDADLLDGLDSTAFLRSDAKAVDADKLDGNDSTYFAAKTDLKASPKIEVFTVSGVWSKAVGARLIDVIAIAAGSPGKYVTGSTGSTGAGGNGGSRFASTFPADALPATLPVVVAPSTAVGNTAADSTLGTLVSGMAVNDGGQGGYYNVNGASIVTQAPTTGSAYAGGGGGAGSGSSGGAYSPNGAPSGALAGGTYPGGAGQSRSGSGLGGSGGAAASTTVVGGDGGIPGGGGGAGSGTSTRAPGAGARGEVIIITYF